MLTSNWETQKVCQKGIRAQRTGEIDVSVIYGTTNCVITISCDSLQTNYQALIYGNLTCTDTLNACTSIYNLNDPRQIWRNVSTSELNCGLHFRVRLTFNEGRSHSTFNTDHRLALIHTGHIKSSISTLRPETKWSTFCGGHFQMHYFSWMKLPEFWTKFHSIHLTISQYWLS